VATPLTKRSRPTLDRFQTGPLQKVSRDEVAKGIFRAGWQSRGQVPMTRDARIDGRCLAWWARGEWLSTGDRGRCGVAEADGSPEAHERCRCALALQHAGTYRRYRRTRGCRPAAGPEGGGSDQKE
jgi:hypothetical protein